MDTFLWKLNELLLLDVLDNFNPHVMFSVKSQRRLKETESDLFYHLSLNFEAVSGVS